MDPIESIMEIIEGKPKSKGKPKRKWREIEQLKEKMALEKEIEFYNGSFDHLLEEVN
ncbi:DUF3545 family protein [Thalassotalea ponticola]|uniref:DUF3545 family protein n=1 Tax=Thalassotalea ponticola TaxID=1523392 RepID=UPI0025B3ACF9|nr:DUF3545 family protein [Thalassotalea ponticola]MDN3651879.1 DUF3545 family protein [Thalassotalea ponticola]